MLVKLIRSVFEHAQEDGDIPFTASDGATKLLHQIENMTGQGRRLTNVVHLLSNN
jgi:hypothetical protein